jgi:glycosyltransferase involved in cell wall biosynthesis
LHVISGDLWAGAEVQAYTLISSLRKMADIELAVALMNEGELAQRLRAAGVLVSVFDEHRLSAYRILAGLRTLMESWRPDVVHTHRSKENVLGSLANRLAWNVPSVRTAHGANERATRGAKARLRYGLTHWLDRWCGRHLQQRVIAVSRELGAALAADFAPQKIVVIENGVDVDAVAAHSGPVEFRQDEPDAIHIGIVGRLVPVKRVDLFLHTAALLRIENPQRKWRFHVFGDGPLRAQLTRSAEDRSIADLVRFHGHRADIVACMAGLDGLIMCSDHEGLPMTALEAAVLGVPIVAHAVGGLADIVPKDLLVLDHTAAGYRDAVLRLFEPGTQEVTRQMSNRVRRDFPSTRNAARVAALYEQLQAERTTAENPR